MLIMRLPAQLTVSSWPTFGSHQATLVSFSSFLASPQCTWPTSFLSSLRPNWPHLRSLLADKQCFFSFISYCQSSVFHCSIRRLTEPQLLGADHLRRCRKSTNKSEHVAVYIGAYLPIWQPPPSSAGFTQPITSTLSRPVNRILSRRLRCLWMPNTLPGTASHLLLHLPCMV